MNSPMESPIEFPYQEFPGSPSGKGILRPATEEDIEAITKIQNQGIQDRIAGVETEVHSVQEQLDWYRDHGNQEPIIVIEYDRKVIGWASLSNFSHRRSYAGVKELSIYLERGWRGKGIGSKLLGHLLKIAPTLEIYKVVLNTLPFNREAIGLFRKFGFRTVGVWRAQGKLDNRWVDMLLMEKHLNLSNLNNFERINQMESGINEEMHSNINSEIVVVKIGGSTLGSHDTTLDNLVALQHRGVIPIVVHGGGKVVTNWMAKQGVMPRFVRGLRVTDAPSLDIAIAVLTGLVNKQLVAAIGGLGGKAAGISGVDDKLLEAYISDPKLGLVGKIKTVNPDPIRRIINSGAIPVIAPIAIRILDTGLTEDVPNMLNINADTAAGEIASAVKASQLIFLTDVPGIFDSSKRLIKKLTRHQAQSLLESGVVSGGMTPKLEACLKGLENGKVSRVVDGRKPGALLDSLEGEEIGTIIV